MPLCPWFVSLCNFTSQWCLWLRTQKWSFIIVNMVGLKTSEVWFLISSSISPECEWITLLSLYSRILSCTSNTPGWASKLGYPSILLDLSVKLNLSLPYSPFNMSSPLPKHLICLTPHGGNRIGLKFCVKRWLWRSTSFVGSFWDLGQLHNLPSICRV